MKAEVHEPCSGFPSRFRSRIGKRVDSWYTLLVESILLPKLLIHLSYLRRQSKSGHETAHPLLRTPCSLRLTFPLLHPISCSMAKSMSLLHRRELDATCYGLGARRLRPRRRFSSICRIEHARPESTCPFTSPVAQKARYPRYPQHSQSRGLGLHPYGHLYRRGSPPTPKILPVVCKPLTRQIR